MAGVQEGSMGKGSVMQASVLGRTGQAHTPGIDLSFCKYGVSIGYIKVSKACFP